MPVVVDRCDRAKYIFEVIAEAFSLCGDAGSKPQVAFFPVFHEASLSFDVDSHGDGFIDLFDFESSLRFLHLDFVGAELLLKLGEFRYFALFDEPADAFAEGLGFKFLTRYRGGQGLGCFVVSAQ